MQVGEDLKNYIVLCYISTLDPGLSLPSLIDLGFSHISGIVCIGHLLRLWNQYLVHLVEWWITAAAVGLMTVQTILTGKIYEFFAFKPKSVREKQLLAADSSSISPNVVVCLLLFGSQVEKSLLTAC